jgi:hypothetical protein
VPVPVISTGWLGIHWTAFVNVGVGVTVGRSTGVVGLVVAVAVAAVVGRAVAVDWLAGGAMLVAVAFVGRAVLVAVAVAVVCVIVGFV